MRRLLQDRSGVAAIEFAILALPFFLMLFAIIEIGIMYFVNSALDQALHRSARQVRTGAALGAGWDLAAFKRSVCGDLTYLFDCSDKLLVQASVITDMASVSRTSGIANGTLSVTETFNIGKAGDYVLIQAFLPWTPVLQYYSYASGRLNDGRYVLAAAELFKNEPF
ncbi:pilus assembly protein [Agrobacterium tumefaciens]|nr:pilus assembly protein [Agrobacterium tumefaciens]NTE74513.1 pilus assembly protein [Agrobacterium tumefaciens]